MTYREALQYLASIEGLGIKLGLHNIATLLGGLGDPQSRFRSVLVAGTNGKGSVAAMLASILRASGHRTGLYTSPHLTRYEERVMVDGRPVRPERFAAGVGRVREATRRLMDGGALEAHPTHFETVTAAAFTILAEAGVEVAVLEVGMGGRLDATVLARPVLALVTNISLEHTRFLGADVGSIASEKAGVLLEGGTLLAAETAPEAVEAFRRRAAETGGTLVELDGWARAEAAGGGTLAITTRHRTHRELRPALSGPHQARNALLAVAAADMLDTLGIAVEPGAVRRGLERTRWPGRYQVLEGRPRVVLDGAHNPAAFAALRRMLETGAGDGGAPTLLLGILRDKDVASMLAEILPAAGAVVTTRGLSPRFMDPWALAERVLRAGGRAEATGDLQEGWRRAREIASPGGTVCVTGSLYLVGDLMNQLSLDPFAPAPSDA